MISEILHQKSIAPFSFSILHILFTNFLQQCAITLFFFHSCSKSMGLLSLHSSKSWVFIQSRSKIWQFYILSRTRIQGWYYL